MKIRTLAVPLLFTLTLLPPAAAQVVETIEVRVVNVDVAVTDSRGRPVAGLTRDSFEILEDGVSQEVTHFYVVEKAVARAASNESTAAIGAPDAERFRRKVLVVVDDMLVSAARRSKALQELETFLERSGDETDWSVVTVDLKPHLILPLTSDKTKVRAALAAVRMLKKNDAALSNDARSALVDPTPYATPVLAFRMDTNEGLGCFGSSANAMLTQRFGRPSLDAMLSAVRGFASVEGKKALFVVTGQLPIEPIGVCDNRYIVARDEENRSRANIRDALTREANASNTSIYILGADNLDAQDITGHGPTTTPRINSSGMYWLATNTGGRLMNDAAMGRSLDEFDRVTSNFYSLGYRPKHSDDQSYHRIVVRLRNGQRYRLAYRNGYSDVAAEQQLERSMRSLIGVAMQKATIPLSLAHARATTDGQRMIISLSASMPMQSVQLIEDAGGARGQIDLYLSVFDESGANVGVMKGSHEVRLEGNDRRDRQIVVNFDPVRLPKGTYTVAAAVRDRLSDEVGVAFNKIRF